MAFKLNSRDRDDLPSYRPIALTAARLFIRRWPLYLLTSAVVLGLEAIFHAFVHVKFTDLYAQLVGGPLIIVVATVYAGSDARDVLPTASERWGRIVERAWAIILVDVGLSIVSSQGLFSFQSADAGTMLLGMLVTVLGAMLVYAEPYICLQDHLETLTMVPFAIVRSMMLAWVNMSRIFALLLVQLAIVLADLGLHKLAASAGIKDVTWIDMTYYAFINAPFAVLIAVAYLDTLSQEPKVREG